MILPVTVGLLIHDLIFIRRSFKFHPHILKLSLAIKGHKTQIRIKRKAGLCGRLGGWLECSQSTKGLGPFLILHLIIMSGLTERTNERKQKRSAFLKRYELGKEDLSYRMNGVLSSQMYSVVGKKSVTLTS